MQKATLETDKKPYILPRRAAPLNDNLIPSPAISRVMKQDLREAYRNMATNPVREAEALEWAEVTCKDLNDEEG
uniref:Uncharacterized protein n=1 Tax=Candidatus Kentrum sp. LPFa TaxID=2126335 RepID=A0A450WC80_9GAMM|nr:MAG: hypothetical protein BECKLPF1236A_GA0070988_1011111 [Candidatus Kentron sp. LPFa]VFK31087.1 MAG: hypothetical protein BECKLPF1236C_GA0070990_1012711 [Candidatus Kentron sp. LPFa]